MNYKAGRYYSRIKCLRCQRKHLVKLKNSRLVICDCKTQLAINGELTASAELLREEIEIEAKKGDVFLKPQYNPNSIHQKNYDPGL